jgi:hypothetical protein
MLVGSIEMKAKIPTERIPDRNSNVGLVLDTAKFHYFDAETDLRIG